MPEEQQQRNHHDDARCTFAIAFVAETAKKKRKIVAQNFARHVCVCVCCSLAWSDGWFVGWLVIIFAYREQESLREENEKKKKNYFECAHCTQWQRK